MRSLCPVLMPVPVFFAPLYHSLISKKVQCAITVQTSINVCLDDSKLCALHWNTCIYIQHTHIRIYINKSHCLSVCLFALRNLRGLKLYYHEIWNVGPISDQRPHRLIRIFIFGRGPFLWARTPFF